MSFSWSSPCTCIYRMQIAVTAHLKSKQLLLFVSALQCYIIYLWSEWLLLTAQSWKPEDYNYALLFSSRQPLHSGVVSLPCTWKVSSVNGEKTSCFFEVRIPKSVTNLRSPARLYDGSVWSIHPIPPPPARDVMWTADKWKQLLRKLAATVVE